MFTLGLGIVVSMLAVPYEAGQTLPQNTTDISRLWKVVAAFFAALQLVG